MHEQACILKNNNGRISIISVAAYYLNSKGIGHSLILLMHKHAHKEYF